MIYRLALAICFISSFVSAAEPANSLTPKEIEEGWIMLFDGETTFGWKTEGDVQVKDGTLIIGGEKSGSIASSTALSLADIRYDCLLEGKKEVEFTFASVARPEDLVPDVPGWSVSQFATSMTQNGLLVEYRDRKSRASGWKRTSDTSTSISLTAGGSCPS